MNKRRKIMRVKITKKMIGIIVKNFNYIELTQRRLHPQQTYLILEKNHRLGKFEVRTWVYGLGDLSRHKWTHKTAIDQIQKHLLEFDYKFTEQQL